MRPLAIASSLLLLALSWGFYAFMLRYDWGQPLLKAAAFALLFLVVVLLRHARGAPPDRRGQLAELAVLVAVVAVFGWMNLSAGLPRIREALRLDIGWSTQLSAQKLFLHGQNLYREKITPGPGPQFGGYKYGPMMVAGYALSAVLPNLGYNLTNLVYFLATFAILGAILRDATALAFASAVLLTAKVYDWMGMGNDLFPTVLLVAGIYAVQKERWFWAGLCAGFSLSAKLSPGIFLVFMFVRRDLRPRFFGGLARGLVPLAAFAAWDFRALFNNYALFHEVKPYDSTSLYSVVPRELHFALLVAPLTVALFVFLANFRETIEVRALTFRLALVLIAFEIGYREVHLNHLIWSLPLLALVFAWQRYALIDGVFSLRRVFT
ncbi:MAG: glycosyltransferase 87 family protein [Myxococcales bacterium]